MNGWQQLIQNQKAPVLKRFMWELLQDRYAKYDELIERICSALTTERDMTLFSEMCIELFEKGFLKSVNEHKEQLAKLGIKVEVVATRNQADNQIGLHE
jgi:hypothetical protein